MHISYKEKRETTEIDSLPEQHISKTRVHIILLFNFVLFENLKILIILPSLSQFHALKYAQECNSIQIEEKL